MRCFERAGDRVLVLLSSASGWYQAVIGLLRQPRRSRRWPGHCVDGADDVRCDGACVRSRCDEQRRGPTYLEGSAADSMRPFAGGRPAEGRSRPGCSDVTPKANFIEATIYHDPIYRRVRRKYASDHPIRVIHPDTDAGGNGQGCCARFI